MRVAGQDELVDTDRLILGNPLGDVLVAADEGRSGAAANQPDSGPEVRRDEKLVA